MARRHGDAEMRGRLRRGHVVARSQALPERGDVIGSAGCVRRGWDVQRYWGIVTRP
ncbi:hypothetical protein BDI4_60113 [Burkholderia diffusa]|nr:hypothetical protein BDI4_60113 [Burkholderia diffusa]